MLWVYTRSAPQGKERETGSFPRVESLIKSADTCLYWVQECADEAQRGHGGLVNAEYGVVTGRKG